MGYRAVQYLGKRVVTEQYSTSVKKWLPSSTVQYLGKKVVHVVIMRVKPCKRAGRGKREKELKEAREKI